MSTDDTREALAAMVHEGKAAGMYATTDHGAAGFCTDHAQPETARLREESQRFYENRNLWQKRAESAEAERDAARAALDRVRALATDTRDRGGSGGVRLVAHVSIADLLMALDPEEPR